MRSDSLAVRLGTGLAISLLTVAAGCSGGGSGGADDRGDETDCSEDLRKQWVLESTQQWYLFQELLPPSVDPAEFTTAEELLDFLTGTAREQGKDRYFSYLTTRAEDDSQLGDGQYVGFGFRTQRLPDDRPFIVDVFEASPAADSGLRRGDEIVAVDSGGGYVAIADLLDEQTAIGDLFGPAEAGVRRGLRLQRDGAVFEVSLVKQAVTIDPVADAGGVSIIPLQGTTGVGYLNLRSYVSSAEPQIIDAFEYFLSQGIDYYIVDLRYNGGGLIYVAELINDLLGGALSRGDVQYRIVHNPARSSEDATVYFQPRAASAWPVRVAFLTTAATASASELNINSMEPWVETAIIGGNTFGKPVGQFAFDLPGCEDRLRLVSFKLENALGGTDYFDGLASRMRFACAAEDSLGQPPGDPREQMTLAAMQWLATGACTSIIAPVEPVQTKPASGVVRDGLPQSRPSPIDHWLPGAT